MPDATITSTASTFGTISGTFAADQSTVTGTVTGNITGTLTGSVGVPGPAGAAGSPGVGVPAAGTTGQVLQKLSATSYDTGWLTLGTMAAQTASDYSTTAVANGLYYPLSGNPSGFLTASALTPYLEKAGGIITGNITSNNNASFISFDNVYKTATLNSAYVQLNNAGPGGSALTIEADGITFPGAGISKQTVAYPGIAALDALFYPLSGNPSGFLTDAPSNGSQYARKNGAWDVVSASAFITSVSSPLSVTTGNLTIDLSAYLTSATAASTYQTLAGMSSYLTTATAASTYYLQTNPSGFQTAGDVTTALSPYLLSATAASTYAVIAAGQPTAGTTGQVLTKNSGTNYDSSWATLIPGDRYLTSSTTSNTVSNGNKTFTIGTGLSYTPTQNITISYDASNHMHGEVLTYNSGTGVLTVDVNHHTGSGTYTAWVVNVGGVTPATSVAWGAITGTLSSQTDLQSALDLKLAATTAASTYQTLAGMSSYLTTSTAASTYQPLSGMSSYLTTANAATTYATILEPSVDGILTVEPSGVNGATVNVNQDANNYIHLRSSVGQIVMVYGGATKWFFNDTYLQFPGGSQQTVAYPGSSTFLLKADNLSGLADTAVSRSNLGLGTMAVETASNYLTTATAASTYQPISGMSSYLTTATAASTYQTLSGMSSYLTSATAASTYFTIANAANKADLASPTFTGTPTLPTGTIATTQSPGNNTTALATTAFVTAAVPAFATNDQVVTGTSTTTALNPGHAGFLKADPRLRQLGACNNTSVAGSGAITGGSGQAYAREMYLASFAAGRAGWIYGYPGSEAGMLTSNANKNQINFSKKIWVSGSCSPGITSGGTSYIGDANTVARVSFGGYSTNATGNMTQKGIGWRKTGGAASFINLSVHNGTTLTNVATTVAVAANEVIDWMIYSDGTGNVTLYINGTQAATTSAGPTGTTTSGYNAYYEQVEGTGTPTVRHAMHAHSGWIYLGD